MRWDKQRMLQAHPCRGPEASYRLAFPKPEGCVWDNFSFFLKKCAANQKERYLSARKGNEAGAQKLPTMQTATKQNSEHFFHIGKKESKFAKGIFADWHVATMSDMVNEGLFKTAGTPSEDLCIWRTIEFKKGKPEAIPFIGLLPWTREDQAIEIACNNRFAIVTINGRRYIIGDTSINADVFSQFSQTCKIEEVFEPTVDEDSFQLQEGDNLLLVECDQPEFTIPVGRAQTLKLTGADMRRSAPDGYWYINGYRVTAECIGQAGLEGDYGTHTDIGGKYLVVERDGVRMKLAHLSNGFGDGDYTLRFRGDSIVR